MPASCSPVHCFSCFKPTVAERRSCPPAYLSPCAQASVRDTVINLYPIEICTPEIGAAQYDALRQLARASGTNRSEIEVAGTMARLVDWAAPLPVFSPVTKVASECVVRGEGLCAASGTCA